ncbi:hypothetical protein LS684_15030 [Cytobacillus spongiae]|uniref:hypothetical protein n=1 Tax=Cytobacillus spongiae TaxID=2901381 RepID=UPI001F281D9C|nr:hypothetical protein [Cytobacillus spongiae]UII54962.1 hypothetical protein LS684_15030 [Cytobacillus spongiae]
MTPHKLILFLVLIIVVFSSAAQFIFEGFSMKTLLVLIATILLVGYLWVRPERRNK